MASVAPSGVSPLSQRLRTLNESGRERLRAFHDAGGTGLEVVHELTFLTDELVRAAFDHAVAAVCGRATAHPKVAIAALGGYGRRQLNPGSDIDVLCLLPKRAGKADHEILKQTLHTLWDAGLNIAHVTRTLEECRRICVTDLKSLTSLLEARFVAGCHAEFIRFWHRFNQHWSSKHLREFLQAQVRERSERGRQFGNTINVAEPNLKESAGGLRDYHFVLWLANAFYDARSLTDLQEKGLLGPERLEKCITALDLLLRLRTALHFHTRRANDQLSYELQEPIARSLGYIDRPGRMAEELLMRDYYRAASTIQDLSTSMALATEATLRRGAHSTAPAQYLRQGWSLHNNQLRYDNSPAALARRPGDLLEVFWLLHEHDAQLSESLRYSLQNNLHLIDDAFRRQPRIAERFRTLLRVRPCVAPLVRAMRDTGFLGAYLPEWQRIDLLVRKDFYHRYSVDEHTLLALYCVERIGEVAPRYQQELARMLEELERIDLLRLAVLFHDIGKGGIVEHSVVGARLATEIMTRLGYPAEDIAVVRFLVLEHLLLSRTAQTRDLHAPSTVEQFIKIVNDPTLLDMLLLLTVADNAAVSDNQLTEWKLQLYWQLYTAARRRLTTGTAPPSLDVSERREQLAKALGDRFDRETLFKHLDLLPRPYTLYTPRERIACHLELLARYDGATPLVKFEPLDDALAIVTICTQDRIGLFARIARAFLRENFSIRDARLQNRKDGIALDDIIASKDIRSAEFDAQRTAVFVQTLVDAISDARPLEEPKPLPPRRHRQTGKPYGRFTPRVEVSNEVLPSHTVVSVHTYDQLGVLYTISATFAWLGYDIHFARVNTEGQRVHDVFYITTTAGNVLETPQEREALSAALRRNLHIDSE